MGCVSNSEKALRAGTKNEMRAAYSISALILTCLAPLLLVLSAYALLVSKPVLHLAVGPYGHYELSMRWVGGWALGAAFLSRQ